MQSETQIDYIAEAIEETFGERCPDYSDGCTTCEAWKRFDYLESLAALSTDAEPVAWMDDGDTRNGSTSNSFRVVTAETKAAMPRASADNFNTPLYAAPTTPLMAVKALQMADETFRDLGWHDKYEATTAALAALSAQVQDVAVEDVLSERKRQVEREGWTPEHDDAYTEYELAWAAITYAMAACADSAERAVMDQFGDHSATPGRINENWPWDWKWWKPKDRRRDLVRAAALIIAEIERLDRAAAPAKQEG